MVRTKLIGTAMLLLLTGCNEEPRDFAPSNVPVDRRASGNSNVADVEQLLSEFKREEYWWSSKISYPFWGGAGLDTYIELDGEAHPSVYQVNVLRALVERTADIRPYFEEEIVRHYRNNIFRSMTNWSPERGYFGAEEITPPLNKASEIWQLLDKPSVYIRPQYEGESGDTIVFRLGFDCHWDPEHGFGVQFRDWTIVDYGGSAD